MTQRNSAQGVALVTGATGGMGAASARALAEAGYEELLLCDMDQARLDAVAAPLRAAGAKVDVLAGSVCEQAYPGEVVKALGGRQIAALVHTAGVGPSGGSPARILDINLVATIRLIDAIRDHMADGSAAVLIASNSAHMPMLPAEATSAAAKRLDCAGAAALESVCPDGFMAYAISKYGVMKLAEHEARAFGAKGARINSISPGATDTAMVASERANNNAATLDETLKAQPIPRIARPEEMASVALFLCSPAASFITATDILVDGGMINLMGV
jgi:NAD(P)-dependent dehydrogenase (short-subunit alcohol dehydrogenase family)